MSTCDLKLGKLPANPKPGIDFMLSMFKVRGSSLAEAPVGFGHAGLVKSYGMLGNDKFGDCVWAGAAHETQMWARAAGGEALFNESAVLSDYSAVTGFNPKRPSTDQGTDMGKAADYRRNVGVVDSAGKRHKIGAYVRLEAGNWHQLLQALGTFEAVGIGIRFPNYAMDQFNKNRPWDYQRGPLPNEGHYIPAVARPADDQIEVVTWGKRQLMSRAFYEHLADEAIAYLSPEMLKSDGKSLEGFALNDLQAAIAGLK